jgi:repressor LexA
VGTIAAGVAIDVPRAAPGARNGRVYRRVVRNRENVFAVRVMGNSMIDALVSDGDVVVLEGTSEARGRRWSPPF